MFRTLIAGLIMATSINTNAFEFSSIFSSFANHDDLGTKGLIQLDANQDGFSDYFIASETGWGLQELQPLSGEYLIGYWKDEVVVKITSGSFNSYPQLCVLNGSQTVHCVHGATKVKSFELSLNQQPNDFIIANEHMVIAYSDKVDIYDIKSRTIVTTLETGANAILALEDHLVSDSGHVYDYSDGMYTKLWSSDVSFGQQLVPSSKAKDEFYAIKGNMLTRYSITNQKSVWSQEVLDNAGLGRIDEYLTISTEGVIDVIDETTGELETMMLHNYNVPAKGGIYSETVPFSNAISATSIALIDIINKEVVWEPYTISQSITAFGHGDLNTDGRSEWIIGALTSQGPALFIVDDITQQITWRSPSNFFEGKGTSGFSGLKVFQADSDDPLEVAVGLNTGTQGYIGIIQGDKLSISFRAMAGRIESLDTADFDNDQKHEIAVAVGNRRVYVMSGNGTSLWNSGYLEDSTGSNYDMHIVDANMSGHKEIFIISPGTLHRINSKNKSDWHMRKHSYRSITSLDVDDDRYIELITGTSDGYIAVNDGKDRSHIQSETKVCSSSVTSVSALDEEHVAYSCHQRVGLFNPSTKKVVWSIENKQDQLGGNANLIAYQYFETPFMIVAGNRDLSIYKYSLNNEPPEPEPLMYTTHWRHPVSGMILAADDTYFVKYLLNELPESGTLQLTDQRSGTFYYEPEGHFTGDLAFSYTAHDGIVSAEPVNSIITITNTKPFTFGATHSVHWKKQKDIQLDSSDVDDDVITFHIVEPPTRGELKDFNPETGMVTYIADGNGSGETRFTYKTNDGPDDSEIATIKIKLENSAPIAISAEYVSNGTNPTSQPLEASDPDGDDMTITITEQPTKGTVDYDPVTTYFTYTPDEDAVDSDFFQFVANDGESDSVAGLITIVLPGYEPKDEDEDAGSSDTLLFLFMLLFFSRKYWKALFNSRD
jgi:hypothetical protein